MSERGPGVRFRLKVYERAKAAAVGEGMPVSRLIEEAVEAYVAGLESKRGKAYPRKTRKALPIGRPKVGE